MNLKAHSDTIERIIDDIEANGIGDEEMEIAEEEKEEKIETRENKKKREKRGRRNKENTYRNKTLKEENTVRKK